MEFFGWFAECGQKIDGSDFVIETEDGKLFCSPNCAANYSFDKYFEGEENAE